MVADETMGKHLIDKINKEYKERDKTREKSILDEKFGKEDEVYKIIENYNNKVDLAEKFIKLYPIYYDKSCLWWGWDKRRNCWEIIDEVDILNLIKRASRIGVIASKQRTEILNALKQRARENAPEQPKKTWIQFNKEVIDYESGERFLATPKYLFTNPITYPLGKNENTPTMDKIFKEWVGKDYVKTLYEVIAYCILADYPIHRLFILIGGGLNGKSCFLKLLNKFIGEKNITTTELDTLLASRFEITRLHKKLVCVMGETNFHQLSHTSKLKKLTGGDLIGYEYKNKNPFEDFSYAKLIIATNTLPVTTDKTIGFYRRQLIIDFPNQFDEKKDILTEIPEEEYNNLGIKSVRILMELLKKREFHNEGSIDLRRQRYEEKSNPLDKFIKDNCDIDENYHIFKYEFRDLFSAFLSSNNYRNWTDREIGLAMKEKCDSRQIYTDVYNKEKKVFERKPYWAYVGIKLKEQFKQDKQDKKTEKGVFKTG